MPGPTPKNPAIRQRKNKSASRALLPAETNPIEETPRLPGNGKGFHLMARQWWADIWSSPQSQEYLRADLPALYRLVKLVDVFWKEGDLSVATEIRLLEREFGLTPLARRRLEWQVIQTEEALDKREIKRRNRAKVVGDPRDVLK
jgi:hypothetical protein